MATLAQRFAALVDRTGPHHLWAGATDRHDVPQMRVDGRLTTARRVAWELQHGPLPHRARVVPCPDESRCVRIEHLDIAEPRAARANSGRIQRARGRGSMREIRPGAWRLTVTTPDHERVYRTITGDHHTAEARLAQLAAEHGHPPDTLDALVAVRLCALVERGRSPSTLRRYEQLWRTWLAPSLGAKHPDELRRIDIETALEAMHQAGQSPRSIHQAAVLLNTTLAWAREQQLVRTNPILDSELPDGTILTGARRR